MSPLLHDVLAPLELARDAANQQAREDLYRPSRWQRAVHFLGQHRQGVAP